MPAPRPPGVATSTEPYHLDPYKVLDILGSTEEFIMHSSVCQLATFQSLFRFTLPAWRVGLEREFHLERDGSIVPIAPELIPKLDDPQQFGYELPACQLEARIGPCTVDNVLGQLVHQEQQLKRFEKTYNFRRRQDPLGPPETPLDVYPDPDGRYKQITASLPTEILRAACRVIGVHCHVGMPDHQTALKVYNRLCYKMDELCSLGDLSNGARLHQYKQMAGLWRPTPFQDWSTFRRHAIAHGFEDDPRKNWMLIRISVHGTIEFRMFDANNDLQLIERWARHCHRLCQAALAA